MTDQSDSSRYKRIGGICDAPLDVTLCAKDKLMKLNDFYNEVSRLVDTDKTKINAAETKRVLSVAFELLNKMDAAELTDTLSKGLAQAKKKAGK